MSEVKNWLDDHWPSDKATITKTDVLILILDFVAHIKFYKGR